MDKLIHASAMDGTLRIIAAITTQTTAEAVRRHQTSPTVSAAFGRVLTGALLLGATIKDFDRLTVKIDANGPVQGIVAEANMLGKVRGYVRNPIAEAPFKDNGKFDVSAIVGGGMFHVMRESGFDIGLHREPYHGSVPIVSGEIAEDFAYYLAKSEQIPSAVLLGVMLQNTEPYVRAAGGIMIQAMPGANEHILTMLEDTVGRMSNLTAHIGQDTTPQDLAKLAMGIIEFEVLDEKEISFECNCSPERSAAMISMLGKDEVTAMLEEDRGAVMTCGFCNEVYNITEEGLRNLLQNMGL